MLNILDRDHGLVVHSRHPYNAEPTPERLRQQAITPVRDFYIRSHGDVPTLDAGTYRLGVAGRVRDSLALSLDELRSRFETHTVVATMQCAGNRRADLHRTKPVSGDPWEVGAIGNAAWTGVRLADILRAAGADEDQGRHVAFAAHDMVDLKGERFRFDVSIPMAKALAPEVLVAWAMNGEALTPEHGYPLRLVVPGFAGIRSPKWLETITVQDSPSDGHMQARDYKLFPPDVSADSVDWKGGVTIQAMPLTSAICTPAAGTSCVAGPVAVQGYATATGRAITRVDVSPDGGRTWRQAELEHDSDAPWSWTLWSVSLELAAGEHELVVRAWDGAGQTQPSRPEDVWNFKGYLSAAWHRVRVTAA